MWKTLDKVEEYLCAFLLFFVSALAFANVIVRYLTNGSLAFTEELVINLFVWITVLGASIAFRKRAHLGVTFLTNLFPPRLQKAVAALSGLAAFALFGLLFIQGLGMVAQEFQNKMATYSMALPMWIFGLAVPIGALIMLVRAVQAAWEEMRELNARARSNG
ncbi:MAG TPA: TRAP transporter small permease [Firmicutes bacterium]|nr:TRAP transporter small permease [Bacillota bacterium]